MTDLLDRIMASIILPAVILISLGALFIGIPLVVYDSVFVKHDYIELIAEQWGCSKTTTVMIPMVVGKIVIPRPESYCVQYSKKE